MKIGGDTSKKVVVENHKSDCAFTPLVLKEAELCECTM